MNLAASWPEEPIAFKLHGNTNGSGGGSVIPPAFRDTLGSGVDFVVTVTIPSADAPSISTLPVTRIGIQQKD
ncbi:MAG: hypothetical protein IPL96_10895 [Holophagaceae bacterium]|nr:hypothetical protein [Holophagaceae bacterium]